MRNFLGVLALLWIAVSAQGTSCIGPITVCSSFDQSAAVFRGRVVAVDPIFSPPQTVTDPDGSATTVYSGPGTDQVQLEVLEVFKGNPARQISVSAAQGMFKEGLEYVVFVNLNSPGNGLVASICSRTHALTDAQDPDLAWLRAYPTAPQTATIFGKLTISGNADEKVAGSVAISGRENRTVAADEQNEYSFKELAPGTYTVSASIPDGLVTDHPQTVTVAAKGCAEVDWYLKYDSHIAGVVSDSSGKPVGGAFVSVLKPEENRVGFTRIAFAQSDEHGAYDVSQIPPGDYWIALYPYAPNNREPYLPVFYPSGSTPATAKLVHLTPSGKLTGVNMTLSQPLQKALVHVRIMREDGTPVNRAHLIAKDVNANLGLTFFDATADADGRADIALYAGQEYSLIAEKPGYREPACGGPVRFVAKEGMVLKPLTLDKSIAQCRPAEKACACPASDE